MNEKVTEKNVDYLKIYEYTDLSRFVFYDKNRKIDSRHLKAMKKDMNDDNLKDFPEIRVDIHSMIVLDGQHRCMAHMQLFAEGKITKPLRVIYMDAPMDEKALLQLIINLNVKGKHWPLESYIHAGNEEGNPISKLIDFCNSEDRPMLHKAYKNGNRKPHYRYGMAITCGRNDTPEIKNNITVNISDEEFAKGAEYYKEAEKVIQALGLHGRLNTWLEAFLTAWHHIRKDPAYSAMLDKIGVNTLCSSITPSDFTTTNKSQWESALKGLIWKVNSRL